MFSLEIRRVLMELFQGMVKRGFDIFLSLVGLILVSPFFLLVSVLIKLDSRGPVLYRQVRIGRDGKPFAMSKFRTMVEAKHWVGPPISAKNDPRVTAFGAVLRRFKINELPQLLNVLKGDMSFVGPRPEVPEFVKCYTPAEQRVLSVRPGLVGPTQISMRNEEELYPEGGDPKEYYRKHILPGKLTMDLEYIDSRSFLKDLGFIVHGVYVTIFGAITRRHLFENAEQIVLFACDIVMCGCSYVFAYFLRMEGEITPIHISVILHTLPYLIIVRMLTLAYLGLYKSLIRYFSSYDLVKLAKGITISTLLVILLTFLVGERSHPRSVFAIDWFILLFLLGGYRFSFRAIGGRVKFNKEESKENVLIFGAGNLGDLALRYLKIRGNSNVVAFVDDDPKKTRKSFQGVKVLGNRFDIQALAQLYHIDRVVIAASKLNSDDLEQIESLCKDANAKCEVFALANQHPTTPVFQSVGQTHEH